MLFDRNNMMRLGETHPNFFNSVNSGSPCALFLAPVGSQWLELG